MIEERTVLIDEITNELNKIKESGKVDQAIVSNLDALANSFREYKEKWLMSPNTKVNLYFYYGARIAELVASRMKERFLSSQQADEGSKTAEDSLKVTTLLGDLIGLAQKKLPDDDSVKLVIERTKQLRVVATDVKFLQPKEKELEDVDKLLSYISRLRK